jgi:hypothetical protein
LNDNHQKQMLLVYFLGLIIASILIVYHNWDKTVTGDLGRVPISQDFNLDFTPNAIAPGNTSAATQNDTLSRNTSAATQNATKDGNKIATMPNATSPGNTTTPNEKTTGRPQTFKLSQGAGEAMRNITVTNNSITVASAANATKIESKISERESTLLYISALFGILGASAHGIASLTIRMANNKYNNRWLPWYIARPPIAAAIAVIVYMLLRAGLIPSSTVQVSAFGIAALSALVGLMTNEITKKLRDICSSLFGMRTSEEDKGDVPLKKDMYVKLSTPKTVIKVGETLEIKAIVINADGKYGSDMDLKFTVTSPILKIEDTSIGKTNSDGEIKVKVKGEKPGIATVTVADLDDEIMDELKIRSVA